MVDYSKDNQVIAGDARSVIRRFPDEHFQAIITSPPYWGVRDYGVDSQIGAEQGLDRYVDDLVGIFREARRTLKPNGVFWLNIGNTYTSGGRKWRQKDKKNQARGMSYRPPTPEGLKKKDLIGLAWIVALACQRDGWYLRSDIIWSKPNGQPESVRDRVTVAHEYLFMLTKSERYYFDQAAIREKRSDGNGMRNKRSVWSINTRPFPEAHFAVFPPALIEPCVLSSTKEGDRVLDPFFGAGTVGLVSSRLSRKWVGVELNQDYIDIAKRRISQDQHQPFLPEC